MAPRAEELAALATQAAPRIPKAEELARIGVSGSTDAGISLQSEVPPEAIPSPAFAAPPQSTLTPPPQIATSQVGAEGLRLPEEQPLNAPIIETPGRKGTAVPAHGMWEVQGGPWGVPEALSPQNIGQNVATAANQAFTTITGGWQPGWSETDKLIAEKMGEEHPVGSLVGGLVGMIPPAKIAGTVASALPKAAMTVQALNAGKGIDAWRRGRFISKVAMDVAQKISPQAGPVGTMAQNAAHLATTAVPFHFMQKDATLETLPETVKGFLAFGLPITGAAQVAGPAIRGITKTLGDVGKVLGEKRLSATPKGRLEIEALAKELGARFDGFFKGGMNPGTGRWEPDIFVFTDMETGRQFSGSKVGNILENRAAAREPAQIDVEAARRRFPEYQAPEPGAEMEKLQVPVAPEVTGAVRAAKGMPVEASSEAVAKRLAPRQAGAKIPVETAPGPHRGFFPEHAQGTPEARRSLDEDLMGAIGESDVQYVTGGLGAPTGAKVYRGYGVWGGGVNENTILELPREVSQANVEALTNIRAALFSQDAGAYFRPLDKGETPGYTIEVPGIRWDEANVRKLFAELQAQNGPTDLTVVDDGARFIHLDFAGERTPEQVRAAFDKAITAAFGSELATGGRVELRRYDSKLIGIEGETDALSDYFAGRPELQGWMVNRAEKELAPIYAKHAEAFGRNGQELAAEYIAAVRRIVGLETPPAAEVRRPLTPKAAVETFEKVTPKQARAQRAVYEALGLRMEDVADVTRGGQSASQALGQLEKVFLGPEQDVTGGAKKTLGPVAEHVATWAAKKQLFPKGIENYTEGEIIRKITEHTKRELAAWDQLRKQDYTSFYTADAREAERVLQQHARKEYGRELKPEEVELFHILSAFGSPGANPRVDSRAGLLLLHRYITRNELDARGFEQGKVWEGGKETDKLKFDEFGNPLANQITYKYAAQSLEKFKDLIAMKGGLKEAIEWIKADQTPAELNKLMQAKDAKGNLRDNLIPENEYVSRETGGKGVFAVTDAKLGSYILNRLGNLSTITKDMWYARTMARLTGEPLTLAEGVYTKGEKKGQPKLGGVVGEPWKTTKEGNRMRRLADEAWRRVAQERGITPAEVQEQMWDFEKELWGRLGHKQAGESMVEGVISGIQRLGELKKDPKTLWQEGQRMKGSVEFVDTKPLIRAFEGSDISTLAHESAHVIRRLLFNKEVAAEKRPRVSDADIDILEKWAGAKDGIWDRTAEEKFARGFERYLYDGEAPTPELARIFAQFKEWLGKIYTALKESDIDVEISPEVRAVLDKAFGKGELKATRAKLIEEGVPRAEAHRLAKAEAGPAPAAPPAVKVEAEPPVAEPKTAEAVTMAIKNETTTAIREAVNLAQIPPLERSAWTKNLSDAVDQKLDERALDIAAEVNKRPRGLSKEETAGMLLKIIDLKKKADGLGARIEELVDRGQDRIAQEARNARDVLLEQLDALTEAAVLGGRESARAMNIRRMLVDMEDLSVAGALREAKIQKGTRLTTDEKLRIETVAKEYEKALRERDLIQAKYDELVAKRDKAIAGEVVRREVRRAGIQSKSEKAKAKLLEERRQIKSRLIAMGHEVRLNDVTGVTAEGLYEIGKLATTYIREGYTNMDALVQKVLSDVPALKDRDVHEALIAKDPKHIARERSAISKRIAEMKTQARLLVELDKAEQGIFEPKVKRARPPQPEEIQDLQRRLRILRRQATKTIASGDRLEKAQTRLAELQDMLDGMYRAVKKKHPEAAPELAEVRAKIAEVKHQMRVEDQISILTEKLRTGDIQPTVQRTLKRPPPELEAKEVQLRMLQKKLRTEVRDLKPKTKWDQASEVVETLRTLKATADMSAAARQGLILSSRLLLRKPLRLADYEARSIGSFFSKVKAETIDHALRNSDNQYLRDLAGLHLSELEGGRTLREEVFGSNLVKRIWGAKHVAAASERHMTTIMNLLRADAFDHFVASNPNATVQELKAIANAINVFSGRGNMGQMAGAAKALSVVVFAPKFSWSRVQSPWMWMGKGKSPRVRKEIAKQLASTAALGVGLLSLARYAGFEVGLDPRSGDFGKIKIGNTRIDIWGGLVQPMRLVVAAGTGMGEHWGILDKGKTEINPLELLGRFSVYKSSPVVGLGLELGFGRNVMWQKVPPAQIPADALLPLTWSDIWEAYNDAGIPRAAAVGGLSFFGIGTSTYKSKPRRIPGMSGPPGPPAPGP